MAGVSEGVNCVTATSPFREPNTPVVGAGHDWPASAGAHASCGRVRAD